MKTVLILALLLVMASAYADPSYKYVKKDDYTMCIEETVPEKKTDIDCTLDGKEAEKAAVAGRRAWLYAQWKEGDDPLAEAEARVDKEIEELKKLGIVVKPPPEPEPIVEEPIIP